MYVCVCVCARARASVYSHTTDRQTNTSARARTCRHLGAALGGHLDELDVVLCRVAAVIDVAACVCVCVCVGVGVRVCVCQLAALAEVPILVSILQGRF